MISLIFPCFFLFEWNKFHFSLTLYNFISFYSLNYYFIYTNRFLVKCFFWVLTFFHSLFSNFSSVLYICFIRNICSASRILNIFHIYKYHVVAKWSLFQKLLDSSEVTRSMDESWFLRKVHLVESGPSTVSKRTLW